MIINLTNVIITSWTVDMIRQRVLVSYQLADAEQNPWYNGEAIFWKEIPVIIDPITLEPQPTPNNWYTIPQQYVSELAALHSVILSAIENKYL